MLALANKKCYYQGAANRINRRKEKKGDSRNGRAPGIYGRLEGENVQMARNGRQWEVVDWQNWMQEKDQRGNIEELAANENVGRGREIMSV